MADDAKQSARRLRLKLALEDLREMKGFGTELVTLIIPPDRQISDARSMLQNEHGQAANIKSKGTRKNVQGAIESAISTLTRFKTPGDHGLAIFVGSVVIGNNKSRMVNIVVEDPPQPLLSFRYRCDSTFELSQLEDMLVDKKSYGLFVIDRSEAAYGIASGKRILVVNKARKLLAAQNHPLIEQRFLFMPRDGRARSPRGCVRTPKPPRGRPAAGGPAPSAKRNASSDATPKRIPSTSATSRSSRSRTPRSQTSARFWAWLSSPG